MNEEDIKNFFMVTEKNKDSYDKIRCNFSDDEIENHPEKLIIAILKNTYGFPISFFDSGLEDNFTLSEEKSMELYEEFTEAIIYGEYEDLYDFTQDFSASLPTD